MESKQVTIDAVNVERHEGHKIIVPESLPLDRAVRVLMRQMEAEEQLVEIADQIPVFPWDGALALAKAIEETFGVVLQNSTWSMFGKNPPHKLSVEVGPNETVTVPWGEFSLPGIDGTVTTDMYKDAEGRAGFRMSATVKGKHEPLVRRLFAVTRRHATVSIYQGKAITTTFTSDGELLPLPTIRFLSPGSVDPIFRREIEHDIERNVLVPLRYPDAIRDAGESLKRGILLAGNYGTGKTMLAGQLAREAVANGWTFIYVPNIAELPHAIRFGQRYQPCLILGEDVDRLAGLERTDKVNELLNVLDGVDSKTGEVMVLLTTNHADKINPAMLRPGRIDARVFVDPPDAEAAERIVRLYGGQLINPKEDLSEAATLLEGEIAATIGEVVKRAKLEAVRRTGSAWVLHNEDLVEASKSFKRERERFATQPKVVDDPVARAATVIGTHIGEAVRSAGNGQTSAAGLV